MALSPHGPQSLRQGVCQPAELLEDQGTPPPQHPRPALLEEAPSARRAALRTVHAPGKGSSASPWGTKAPRPEPRRLTDGREEEPSLVDGRDPLLLVPSF